MAERPSRDPDRGSFESRQKYLNVLRGTGDMNEAARYAGVDSSQIDKWLKDSRMGPEIRTAIINFELDKTDPYLHTLRIPRDLMNRLDSYAEQSHEGDIKAATIALLGIALADVENSSSEESGDAV